MRIVFLENNPAEDFPTWHESYSDNCLWGEILVRNWLYISVTSAVIERLYFREVSNWLVLKGYCYWIRTRQAGNLRLIP